MTAIIIMREYGAIISDRALGEKIYHDINQSLKRHKTIVIDFKDIKSMATFNAKQIFGRLYLELGSSDFFERINLKGTSENIKLIIRMGIQSALEEL